ANAAAGCLALYFILDLDFETATYCVLVCCVFDFLDGFLARVLGVTSEFGKQLDSLADVISFGVVPGTVATLMLGVLDVDFPWFFIGFIITLASAYRLANYNTSDQNKAHFSGLPTPANALLWIGLTHIESEITFSLIVGAVIFTSFLLNSSFAFYRIQLKYSLLSVVKLLVMIVLMIALLVQFGHLAWSIAITVYILFSFKYSLLVRTKV
ncbi:MAG: CDP-alcohol phosphatidyltransferase family protein, partial [Bacteroidota bacterium]|nr:CDP-alcohol phosphatidyltransferase family protein [Bacteroidota bacterium]